MVDGSDSWKSTPDNRVHAYNVETGELLWEERAPTSAMATPMTYEANGRQFVVFAAGGQDPDDLIRSGGRAAMDAALAVGDWVLAAADLPILRGYTPQRNTAMIDWSPFDYQQMNTSGRCCNKSEPSDRSMSTSRRASIDEKLLPHKPLRLTCIWAAP